MTKFLSYIIITVGILAVASWLTAAQAHEYKAGDIGGVMTVCYKRAHDALTAKAQVKGLLSASVRDLFRRKANNGLCFIAGGKPHKIIAALPTTHSADGWKMQGLQVGPVELRYQQSLYPKRGFWTHSVIYLIRLTKPVYTLHSHKVEGQEA
ncbi:hypothetical protein LCGC14_2029180 [marine sediment metagenome]|uniref:Uncharacterized protein n=1 Tax=marine sediment metagenome TaxID=412755 RepID=A0A0F9H8L7_9ZZZZ